MSVVLPLATQSKIHFFSSPQSILNSYEANTSTSHHYLPHFGEAEPKVLVVTGDIFFFTIPSYPWIVDELPFKYATDSKRIPGMMVASFLSF